MYARCDDTSNKKLANKTTELTPDVINMRKKNNGTELENFEDIYDASHKVNRKHSCKPMTVNELYEETLVLLLCNNNGNELSDGSETLVEYIREVFEVSQEKHLELLKKACIRKPLQKTLTIEVDRAENLLPMDSNGLSDAFVVTYIESNSTNRYNTTVVPSTLNPSWNERFIIPLQRTPVTEMLIIEVWDFDAAESVAEKMNKIAGVKGIRGFKKLLKEIALTASTGKHDNELIGRTDISLQSIPPEGSKAWYTLKKSSNNKSRGTILLHLYFSTEKNQVIAMNEHRNLLRIFLLHELKLKNAGSYTWSGIYDAKADSIIRRHKIHNNLSEMDCCLCQWEIYTKVHQTHCLSLKLFNTLLSKLEPEMQGTPDVNESVKANQFWEGYKKILPSCFLIVRSIRSDKFEEIYGIDNLSAALEIIKKAEPPAPFDELNLFPPHIYGWLGKTNEGEQLSADFVLKETIKLSAIQFLNKIYANNALLTENTLQQLITIMRSLISDLQVAVEYHDKHFYMKNNLKYSALLYNLYEENVKENFFPKIIYLCSNLAQLNVLDEEIVMVSNINDFKTGTLLFDLYLGFKRFTSLGSAICVAENNFVDTKFYECFYPAVANWLNISLIKTLTRIEKAIELDEFIPYNNVMKYSSSALDTLSLFYQIKYFWEQLDWPNIEESYLFVEKMVNDVCRCSIFYASRLSQRTGTMKRKMPIKQNSQGSKELCYAINDINYIKESLPLFVKELRMDDILKKLAELRSTLEAERCSVTINNIISNAVDIVESKMFELVEVVAQMIISVIQQLFQKGSEIQYENSNYMSLLLKDFQKSVDVFRNDLQDDSLNKLTEAVGDELSKLMPELVQQELDKCRQPSFFENMHRILNITIEMLNLKTHDMNKISNLKKMCSIVKLHAMETECIIHQYYKDQLLNQEMNTQNQYGQLSIKANLSNDSLKVHILNAYQLLPMDSENSCNSYVKVHFIPAERFIGINSLKTSVQSKTRCPLYDEQFFIKLTPAQFQSKDSILVFCAKNKDLFGLSNYYIAECYLSFADIEKANNKQMRMNLRKPKYSDNDKILALASRAGDKQAKDFLKKLKHKSLNHNKNIH